MKQPLEGIRVLELALWGAGPGGAAILGDLGAEVIKIEHPKIPDPVRVADRVGHVSVGLKGGGNVWNEAMNRNKKSVTLDLNKEKGREAAYRLVKKSDVFLTSFRRPALETLKMGYPILYKLNPQLIYARISGFGPKGPDRDVGGFDYQGQSRSGLMYTMGEPDMPPLFFQFGIIDQTTSIMASHQVITALLMRERFGIGQEVHVSLLSTAMYMQYMNVNLALAKGLEVPRHKRATEYPLRNYYECADGKWFSITIANIEADKKTWPTFCEAIGRPELAKEPKFATYSGRDANSEELVALLDESFAARPRKEWLEILIKHDFPVAPINRLNELVDDPQIIANDYIVDFEHPRLGKTKIPGYPIHFSKTRAFTRSAAPGIGEHSVPILKELAGYSEKEIAQLKAEDVV